MGQHVVDVLHWKHDHRRHLWICCDGDDGDEPMKMTTGWVDDQSIDAQLHAIAIDDVLPDVVNDVSAARSNASSDVVKHESFGDYCLTDDRRF